MKTINRIRFFSTKSPRVRCYGISKLLTNNNASYVKREKIDEAEYKPGINATLESIRAGNRLLDLPGVTVLRFYPYEVHVNLATVYDWSDIHDQIVAILKECYFADASDVAVQEGRGLEPADE